MVNLITKVPWTQKRRIQVQETQVQETQVNLITKVPWTQKRRFRRPRFRRPRFRGIVVDGYSKRDFHVVVPVDDDLFHDRLENPLALLIGQLVNALADLLRPGEDILHQPPLLSPARLLNPAIVQLRPGALKPLGDELALEIELGLGDLPRHEQPDGAVLFHLDVPQVSLGLGDDADNPTYIFTEPRVGYRMPKGDTMGQSQD